jgi:N-acetylmuramoyl-L-alanine amidase
LTLSLLGLVLWASPAEAGRLTSWQFDNRANQLRFTTDDGVQPTARLIADPTRLVIDLPGTTLSRPTVTQRVGGTIREVRIGQFNANTTRLVIELAPGYTLDPERVEFRGTTDRQWQVTLPPPERIDLNQGPVTGLDNFQVTQNGFFVRLAEQSQPQATVSRSRDRKEIAIAIRGNRIPDNLQNQTILINRYGVDTIQFDADAIRLTVDADGPDWRAAVSRAGIAIVPSGGQVLNGDRTTVPLPSDEQVVQIPVPPPERITPPPQPAPSPGDFRVPNSRILTTIDPGHGGRDPGAIGIGGLREKDVVLPISLEVARILSEAGVSVLMTRSDDRFISLQGRAAMANQARSTLFVSIHANAISMSRPDVNGVETYFFSGRSRNFANTVHQSIMNQIRIGNRGVKQARFYVLRNTSMPSILVEVGFVTGAQDAPRLADPAFRDQMARAIADGILRYVSDNY